MLNSTAIFLDSSGLFVLVMMRLVAVSSVHTLVLVFLKMFMEVVSIVNPSVLVLLVNLLSLGSLDEHLHSNPLRFAC